MFTATTGILTEFVSCKVREGVSGQSFNSTHGFRTRHFMALTFRLEQFFQFMVTAHAYRTFELCGAVPLLAKTAAREQKQGPCPEIPYCPEIPSLTLICENVTP